MDKQAPTTDAARYRLASQIVVTLPKFGRWAEAIRDYETPWGKVGYRQLELLWVIRHHLVSEDDPSPTDLATYYEIQPSVITRVLVRLVEHGFVIRVPDPVDGRRSTIKITETGRQVSEYVEHLYIDEVLATLGALEGADLENLQRAVSHLDQIGDRLLGGRHQRNG